MTGTLIIYSSRVPTDEKTGLRHCDFIYNGDDFLYWSSSSRNNSGFHKAFLWVDDGQISVFNNGDVKRTDNIIGISTRWAHEIL